MIVGDRGLFATLPDGWGIFNVVDIVDTWEGYAGTVSGGNRGGTIVDSLGLLCTCSLGSSPQSSMVCVNDAVIVSVVFTFEHVAVESF